MIQINHFLLQTPLPEHPISFYRKNIKAGYRSPFLLEFAEKVASGKLDVECWRSSELTTESLFKELRLLKVLARIQLEIF